jgi:hypothetical protein
MKTIREIRDETNEIYTKSSHYIAEVFLAIGAIVAIAKGVLDLIGVQVGLSSIVMLSVLFSPLELGMIKASLLACDRQAKQVKTNEFTLMGLKNYFKIFVPFVGRSLLIYVIEALILVIFIYASTGTISILPTFLQGVLSGNLESILSNNTITLSFGMLAGVILALVAAFFAEAYLGLSYYFVVEDEMSLGESLSASIYCMRGNITKYIGIKLVYIIPTIIALVGVNVFSIAFRTMFQQLVAIVPGVPIVVFNLMLVVINSIVSAFLSVILYKVKESISFALLYRDLKNAYYE